MAGNGTFIGPKRVVLDGVERVGAVPGAWGASPHRNGIIGHSAQDLRVGGQAPAGSAAALRRFGFDRDATLVAARTATVTMGDIVSPSESIPPDA